MLDAIILERAGIPAVPIVTSVFESTAKEMAELWGVPNFRFLMMPHPLASLSAADIAKRAEDMVPRVLELLASGQPE
ncbi:MAG: hypothetical protein WD407_03655 [Rhodospirillales bacterium]